MGVVAMTTEPYAVTVHWWPSAHTDLDDPITETFAGWTTARSKALKLTTLRGSVAVVVRDADGDVVAHWDAYSNRWHEQGKGKGTS
jgi:hypothetical protein